MCSLVLICWASASVAEPTRTPQVTFPGGNSATSCNASTKRELASLPLIHITADHADFYEYGPAWLKGNVTIAHRGVRIRADEIKTDKLRQMLELNGHIQMMSDLLHIHADTAVGNLTARTFTMDNTRYQMSSGAKGKAESIRVIGENRAILDEVSYTTCSDEVTGWELSASNISLNNAKNRGSARDVVLEVAGVPVFYFPYLIFPTSDERQSGFLVPSLGQSSRRGFEIQVPYYWNIAPNMDLTVSPRMMTKRGVELNSEFRYLGEDYEGLFAASYLPHDREYGDYRAFGNWQHLHRLGDAWTIQASISQFSDRDYFDDLGDKAGIRRDNYIASSIQANYRQQRHYFSAAVQRYDLLDSNNRPFQRLPELRAGTQFTLTGTPDDRVDIGMRAEAIFFDHDSKEHGARWEVNPFIQLFYQNEYSKHFVETGLRLGGYQLDDPASNTERTLSRDVGYLEAWSQWTFERTFDWYGTPYRQTLEPRVGYAYQHQKDQSAFPVFDSSQPDDTYQRLFKKDRVVGIDRANDANHFTLGVWNRLGGASLGTDFLELGIGQQWLLDDETEQLPGNAVRQRGASDLFLDLRFRADENINLGVNMSWNHRSNVVTRTRIHLDYEDERTHFHLAWHHRDQTTEFSDLAFAIPLDQHWRMLSRWQHSWSDDKSLDFIAGLEFENCCLAVRVLGRNYVTDSLTNRDEQLLLQFELKGLSTVGHSVANPLDHGILKDK